MTTLRKILTLGLTVLLTSCVDKTKTPDHFINVAAQYYENAKTDTTQFSFEDISYNRLCEEMDIRSYTPEESKLTGSPNSFTANINAFPNYTKEEAEKISKETGFYIDTTDRDFDKYWYNDKGLLEKYENKKFGDMIHTECIFSYNQNNLLKEIEINDMVTDNFKYKNRTIKIENNKSILELKHNIVK